MLLSTISPVLTDRSSDHSIWQVSHIWLNKGSWYVLVLSITNLQLKVVVSVLSLVPISRLSLIRNRRPLTLSSTMCSPRKESGISITLFVTGSDVLLARRRTRSVNLYIYTYMYAKIIFFFNNEHVNVISRSQTSPLSLVRSASCLFVTQYMGPSVEGDTLQLKMVM